jgi:hypothetical protein
MPTVGAHSCGSSTVERPFAIARPACLGERKELDGFIAMTKSITDAMPLPICIVLRQRALTSAVAT